jgi:hypothetical protein
MSWMNEPNVLDAAERWFDKEDTPNLHEGAQILARLMRWTNSHSDGWPYWQKPSRAANMLMTVLQEKRRERFDGPDDLTDAELKKLLSPIKAFLTRQGADHSVLEAPKPSAEVQMFTDKLDRLNFLWNEVHLAADAMLRIDNGGTWNTFSCTEIEALTDVFRAAGRDDVADFILAEHAEGDEPEDEHYQGNNSTQM